MTSLLDIRTLTIASAIIAVILGGYMAHMRLTRKTYPGFRQWTWSALGVGLGLILIGLRGLVPDLITVVLANALTMVAMLLIYRGLSSFCGQRPGPWPDACLMAIYLGAIWWFTFGQPSVQWRIIIFSFCFAYYAWRSARLAFGPVAALLGARNWQLISAMVCLATFFTLRGLLNLLWQSQTGDLMSSGTLQALTLVVSFAGHVLVFTGLVFLNIQRLELELTSAQQELRVLGGLLPICSNCKRIRDDSGYWHQVERYISAHSQAEFTHGICPQCLQDLYPEVAESLGARANGDPEQASAGQAKP